MKSAIDKHKLHATDVAHWLVQETFGSAGKGELYIDFGALTDRPDLTEICLDVERRLISLYSDAQYVFRLHDLTSKKGVAAARQLLERNGVAFRVKPSDYHDPALSDLRNSLKKLGVSASAVDLIIDFQVIGKGQGMRTAARLERYVDWRSVTYVGGSFPPNLIDLKKNEQHELPRHEWMAYLSARHDRARTRFGDYTVQHPMQPDPPLKNPPSASIRYTSDTYWVIMRGEKAKPNGPGREQYIGQAQLLCERPEYKGREYSYGDEYIYIIATEMTGKGTPETWLRAAMNHHMTVAAHQIVDARAA